MPARTRRQFLLDTATLLATIQRAAAIEAEPRSTYLDAGHVVILMQENRSFDHLYGALRGVRGFNDPRAVTLPDGKPVWQQTNAAGETYGPFRLDIRKTNATWLGSLPHSWRDQTDARNHGNHDGWLEAKRSGRKECAAMPLTMGYYDRSDLPFYYALADAFTVCDQHFCSSLTGTTPNRHYLWTGTVRPEQNVQAPAYVRNSDTDWNSMVRWTTYPERLEDAGISWKIYQNEVSIPTGLTDDEDAWLANFTDNPMEWFEQYRVQFSKGFREHAAKIIASLPEEEAARDRKKTRLLQLAKTASGFTDVAWSTLPQRDRNLHEKAFCTNSGDPAYRELTTHRYRDGNVEHTMTAPKGDVLYQFRKDVAEGKLPRVSWIVPSENFSDHPGAPWYGAWMVSEVMRILTENPAVWKKTIVILTYDENDGYFDHVPPFVAPDPARPETGKVSDGIDAGLDYWPAERDPERGGPIGLGYRVPLVIASPWSRGGVVCSQVFDHTSVLQLLEKVVGVREPNISTWRRAVCGDLSSAFQPARSGAEKLKFPSRDTVIEGIHKAQFQPAPAGFREAAMPRQEPGVRPSLPLPYELHAGGALSADRRAVEIWLEAGKGSGAPFHVYTPGTFRNRKDLRTRAYAVATGQRLTDTWELDGFENGVYYLRICGPNGFFRELAGSADDPAVAVGCEYRDGDLVLIAANRDSRPHTFRIQRSAIVLKPGEEKPVVQRLARTHAWYDVSVRVDGSERFARRFAGRVETGKMGYSDPLMGGLR